MKLEDAINTISRFLALRQIEELTPESLEVHCGAGQADVLLAFGNDLPEVAEAACRAYLSGICKKILFAGGVGHSTQILKDKMKAMPEYRACDLSGAEADIYAEIARKKFDIPEQDIFVENASRNCSENGRNALRILREYGIPHQVMILLQDPTMQYRSYVSMADLVTKGDILISYAPFVPQMNAELEFTEQIKGLWPRERFYSLLMGEIRRLRDDENGYGPKGCGFIPHVDIPVDVAAADEVLHNELECYAVR